MNNTIRHAAMALLATAIPSCTMPGGGEWMWIALIALLLFGSTKLPGMMRSMGSGINEFKKGLKTGEGDDSEPESDEEK